VLGACVSVVLPPLIDESDPLEDDAVMVELLEVDPPNSLETMDLSEDDFVIVPASACVRVHRNAEQSRPKLRQFNIHVRGTDRGCICCPTHPSTAPGRQTRQSVSVHCSTCS
jgi:hypothetical protein